MTDPMAFFPKTESHQEWSIIIAVRFGPEDPQNETWNLTKKKKKVKKGNLKH